MITDKLESSAHIYREQSLLRELIVLTLRHIDGDLLRFVPPLGNEGQNQLDENLFTGVIAHPRVGILWSNPSSSDCDEINSNDEQDLLFRSSHLSLLQSGAQDAISLCAQCGLLYSRISNFCSTVDNVEYTCSVTQALSVRMKDELEWYYSTLANLEGGLGLPKKNAKSGRGMTLRGLVVCLPPIRDRLRSLAMVAGGVGIRNLRGGKLLSAILSHSYDGESQHARLVQSVSAEISKPWYSMLHQWITQGSLEDVHSEFFVMELSKQHECSMSSGYFSWHRRFVLVEGQIPRQIMTEDVAREVLLVGKGINFIRYCLMDVDWQIDGVKHPNDSDIEEGKKEHGYDFVTLSDLEEYEDESRCISTLHDVITKSSIQIHRHILDSFLNQHKLIAHLHAIKRFLFLGQGDFVSSIVESLHQEFRGRSSLAGIYSHSLNSVLEGALGTSNARFLPDFVLARLNMKLMTGESHPDRYWMGPPPKDEAEDLIPWEDKEESIDPWNCICLEYVIDSPLDAIVHTTAIESYHRVFMFLFRLKRVEWMLNHSWRQSTTLNHAILIETKAGGADAPHISAAAGHSSFLLRRMSSTRQTMLHFISNMQNYLMFEVLEDGWERLLYSINKATSLDGVISAHDSYLNEILVKTLLSKHSGDDQETSKGKSPEDLLKKLLSIALRFGKFQDFIFGNALAALDKSAHTRRLVDETSKKGTWGRKTVDEEEGRVFIYLADAKLFQYVEKTTKDFDKALVRRTEINIFVYTDYYCSRTFISMTRDLY